MITNLKNLIFLLVLAVTNPLILLLSISTEWLLENSLDITLLPWGNESGMFNIPTQGVFMGALLSTLYYSWFTFTKYKKTEKILKREIKLAEFLLVYLPAQATWAPIILLELIFLYNFNLGSLFATAIFFMLGGIFVLVPLLALWAVIVNHMFKVLLKKKYPGAFNQKI